MKRRDLFRMPAAIAVPAAGQVPAAVEEPRVDPHQGGTIAALVELILPGAREARVARYLELFLRDGPTEDRQAFLEGLAWLDGHALRTARRPLARCDAATQLRLLETIENSTGDALAPGRDFVALAKRMTAQVYYATEAGFKELNRGGRVPQTFGCTHPGKEHA
jgi:hypothetical protein